jgi:acyl-CoA synthetase (AMP-forming)/AMP-acid ligase II
MRGQMMAFPLTIPALLRRTETFWRDRPVVTRAPDRSIVRSTYGDCLRRARQLAVALERAGIQPGDRVATFSWNHQSHLETYFGVPMAGAVLHTLNLRLHPADLGYIVEHADDAAIVLDASLADAFAQFRDRIPRATVIVVGGSLPGAVDYETFIAGASPDEYQDRVTDEHSAAAMCYTSGTTGRPKGVVYSHYGLCLHALAMTITFRLSESDTILPIVPMFHANAWGLPFTCAMLGAGLVLPGPFLDPASVLELLASERVTWSAGVPTIWAALSQALEAAPGRYDLSALRGLLCGGSAVPASMIKTFQERHGARIFQAWGMTETGPLATAATVDTLFQGLTGDQRYALAAKQGWAAPFVELRLMTPEGEAPRDGQTMGEIEVRGPWIANGYYKDEAADRFSADGWFRTGDIATLDETGCVQIQDRAKDLIKSGGEWISSVAIESALAAHPAVAEAAVIAVSHPHWQERPLAVVVLRAGAATSAEELRLFLAPQFAKWWLPDAFEFVDTLPRTATGKLLKYALRQKYQGYKLAAAGV